MMILVCVWIGVACQIIPVVIPEFNFLPWNWLGICIACIPYILIIYRGKVAGQVWKILDFPAPGQHLGLMDEGNSIYVENVVKSIAGYLKTKKDRYFKDDPDGSVNFGGHSVKHINVEVSHCYNPREPILINKWERDGFYSWGEMIDLIKEQMVNLKTKNNEGEDTKLYVLSNSERPLYLKDVDIENNKGHKKIFEYLADKNFVRVNGRVFSTKNMHRFQEKQAAPIQIGNIIHYVKAFTAMRAARVRKETGMGNILKFIAVIIGIVAVIIFAALILTGQITF